MEIENVFELFLKEFREDSRRKDSKMDALGDSLKKVEKEQVVNNELIKHTVIDFRSEKELNKSRAQRLEILEKLIPKRFVEAEEKARLELAKEIEDIKKKLNERLAEIEKLAKIRGYIWGAVSACFTYFTIKIWPAIGKMFG